MTLNGEVASTEIPDLYKNLLKQGAISVESGFHACEDKDCTKVVQSSDTVSIEFTFTDYMEWNKDDGGDGGSGAVHLMSTAAAVVVALFAF